MDEDDEIDPDLVCLHKKEVQELIDDCWQTIATDNPAPTLGGKYNQNTHFVYEITLSPFVTIKKLNSILY